MKEEGKQKVEKARLNIEKKRRKKKNEKERIEEYIEDADKERKKGF